VARLLRTVAILAGVLNAFAYERITSSEALVGDWAEDASWIWAITLVSLAGCTGLLVAEVLLRVQGEGLRQDFWSRALAIWLGFVVGGALVSLSVAVTSLLTVLDFTAGNVLRSLVLAPVAMTAGGFVGLAEGALLAVPLAALLRTSTR
jgi:hypothetical protein